MSRCPFARAFGFGSVAEEGSERKDLAMATISLSGLRFLPGPDGFGLPEWKNRKKRTRNWEKKPDRGNVERSRNQREGLPGESQVKSGMESNTNVGTQGVGETVHSNFQAKCPMAKVPGLNYAIGGLLKLASRPHKLSCPAPIVKLRALLAQTEAVKNLRPKKVPVKIMAVAGAGAATNVPLGMWREHTEKFSLAWFVAVHASLPFVIALRKACIMPRYAVLFTITAAVLGQALGARIERRRLTRKDKIPCGTAEVPAVATRQQILHTALVS